MYEPWTQPDAIIQRKDRRGDYWTDFEYNKGTVPCGLRRATVKGYWNTFDAVFAIMRRGEGQDLKVIMCYGG